MSAGQQSSSQQAASWTEPPWSGWIETTGDALLILEAAKRGIIPRVTRRLVDSERRMIMSGSVFVFEEEESGIRRWTDGFYWSPSRILGNFLLYRETDKRSAANRGGRADNDMNDPNDPTRVEGHSLSRPRADSAVMGVNRHRERILVGSLTNTYKFKPDGLMKKTFSLTINGVAQHLISYYKVEDVESGRLRSPSSLPELASLDISPEYLDKTHFRNPPKVEIGVDGILRYRGEADDIDTTGNPTSPFSPGPCPILSPPEPPKRGQRDRFTPYVKGKRPRKDSQPDSSSSPGDSPVATTSTIPPQPTTSYPVLDNSNPIIPTPPPQPPTPSHYPPYGIPAYYPPYGHHPPPGAVYGPLPPNNTVGVAYLAPPAPPGATASPPLVQHPQGPLQQSQPQHIYAAAPPQGPGGIHVPYTYPGYPPPSHTQTSGVAAATSAPEVHGSNPSQVTGLAAAAAAVPLPPPAISAPAQQQQVGAVMPVAPQHLHPGQPGQPPPYYPYYPAPPPHHPYPTPYQWPAPFYPHMHHPHHPNGMTALTPTQATPPPQPIVSAVSASPISPATIPSPMAGLDMVGQRKEGSGVASSSEEVT
ncbi:hypothetical protein CVT24_007615 [Panaeolus cyanescens]|uniref:Uncharacterized protein n=1 Tax=Panaeolus cyanescens TaxID=181874 RepID=A0A409YKL3_9AGAR|nr:hypothetical protein CVT24_007615 [Panaeolus cyanescens]